MRRYRILSNGERYRVQIREFWLLGWMDIDGKFKTYYPLQSAQERIREDIIFEEHLAQFAKIKRAPWKRVWP